MWNEPDAAAGRMMPEPPERLFDVILDEWPSGTQGDALRSLVASWDVSASELPYGFVGIRILRRIAADASPHHHSARRGARPYGPQRIPAR